MSDKIPASWTAACLSELLIDLESGSRPRGGVRGIACGVPSIGGEHLKYDGSFDFTAIKYVSTQFAAGMSKGHIETNDILVVKDGATTGKTAFVDARFPFHDAVVNEHVFICRPIEQIEPRFLFRFLMSKNGQDRILENFKGSAQGGINKSFVANTEVPLAPFNEQRRIVAKLEKLLDKADSCQKRLAKIPILLKRFRQAVLAAACSGSLTADWREANFSVETAEDLITRTATQRQTKFALLKKRSSEKPNLTSTDNFKPKLEAKYDLGILPDTWAWVDLHFLMSPEEPFCYGVVQPGVDEPTGIPLVRAGDISAGRVSTLSLRRIPSSVDAQYPRSRLRGGELLVTVVGAGIGEAAIAQSECLGFNVARAVAKIPIREFSATFVYHWLCTITAVAWMKGESREVARPTLNLEQLQTMPVPLPPLAEQHEIVRRVGELFALADQVEARHAKAKQYVDSLKQSILAKTFRGDLVPQDPNDEPASVLLERIRGARGTKNRPARR
jgi:type I restriction enzyme S subunit